MAWTAEQSAEQRTARIATGLCARCGLQPPAIGFRDCSTCREHVRAQASAREAGRRAQGLCRKCDRKAQPGKTQCKWHNKRVSAYASSYLEGLGAEPTRIIMALLRRAKGRAKEDGREFSITLSDLGEIPTYCPILGIELAYTKAGSKGPRNASPSIDRIDNTRGYVKGNVRIISFRANTLRRDATLDEIEAVRWDMWAIAANKLKQH